MTTNCKQKRRERDTKEEKSQHTYIDVEHESQLANTAQLTTVIEMQMTVVTLEQGDQAFSLSLFLFLAHLLSFCCALVSIANKRARLRTHKLGRGIEKKGVLIMQSSNDVYLPVLGDSYNWQCLPAACLPVLNDCHVTGVVSFSFAFFFPLFINSSHVGSLPSWCCCCCCWHSSAPTPAPQ